MHSNTARNNLEKSLKKHLVKVIVLCYTTQVGKLAAVRNFCVRYCAVVRCLALFYNILHRTLNVNEPSDYARLWILWTGAGKE